MPLFKNRLKAVEPLPTPQIIHNYRPPSRVGPILILFLVAVASLALSYQGLVYLLAQTDMFADANSATAILLLACLGGSIVLGILGAGVRYVLADLFRHRELMADKAIELETARAKVAQIIPPSTAARMTSEESRKYQAVKLVMSRVYGPPALIDDEGKLVTGNDQPWSKRAVGRLVLLNEKTAIGENTTLSSWVKAYLLDKGILVSERQVDLARFPNLASVETQLVKDFGTPIIFGRGEGMAGEFIQK